jgi:hypothetical protein
VVAKWSRPWLVPTGTGLRSTVLLRSASQARELYLRAEEAGSRLLLQAFLPPGPERDWFFHGYVDRTGRVHGGGADVKLRSWPRDTGLTAVGRWAPNPTARAVADRLTAELGYRGILDLAFHRCGSTGRYRLLDFNPRPGAQFRLFADAAGLDVVRAQHPYAPLRALRPASPGREHAWHAPDDRGPGRALWPLWTRHVAHRLRDRVGGRACCTRRPPPVTSPRPNCRT